LHSFNHIDIICNVGSPVNEVTLLCTAVTTELFAQTHSLFLLSATGNSLGQGQWQ
jgi:hypothetical protein